MCLFGCVQGRRSLGSRRVERVASGLQRFRKRYKPRGTADPAAYFGKSRKVRRRRDSQAERYTASPPPAPPDTRSVPPVEMHKGAPMQRYARVRYSGGPAARLAAPAEPPRDEGGGGSGGGV